MMMMMMHINSLLRSNKHSFASYYYQSYLSSPRRRRRAHGRKLNFEDMKNREKKGKEELLLRKCMTLSRNRIRMIAVFLLHPPLDSSPPGAKKNEKEKAEFNILLKSVGRLRREL
jgi:hypothetical protein